MKLKIVQIGDPVLRRVAKELTLTEIHSERIQQLIELMKETMRDSPGVGLAAPQIGESLQLAVIEDRPEYIKNISAEQIKKRQRTPVPFHVIINPRYNFKDTDTVEFYEGCLSMAGFVGSISRAVNIKVDCLNEHAQPCTLEASGWYARILQHEIDHLHGKLCIDRMNLLSLTTAENYQKYWAL